MAQRAYLNYVHGYTSGSGVEFSGKTEANREISVIVPPLVIAQLGVLYTEIGFESGHASWHYHNPDSICNDCKLNGQSAQQIWNNYGLDNERIR